MTAIAAFKLTSQVTQAAAPFMIGHGFAKGDVPAGQYAELDLANFVVQPLTTWNDGSLKTAALIGRVALTANTAKQVNIVKRSTAPTAGTLLTAASIQTAAPAASIQFGSFGTVSLAGLLASPVRTYISTSEMVECHYVGVCGADPSLRGEFHVRLFVDGRIRVRAIGHNGYLNGTEFVQKDYIPTVTIGGVMVWNNGGAAYKHSRWAGWDQIGWIGTDPQVTPQHDTGYLTVAKFLPNYWKKNPSQAAIDAYAAMAYTPGANLDYSANMGAVGFQNQLGLLPQWDALYCTTNATPAMYRAVIAHARAARSYGICFYDANSKKPIKISDFPRWSIYGLNQGGAPGAETIAQNGTALVWEKAHGASMAYLAALLTADYYHIETCCLNALTIYLCGDINAGDGLLRSIEGQNRAKGWGRRSYGQASALIPDGLIGTLGEIRTHLGNMMRGLVAKYVTPTYPSKWMGYEDMYGSRLNGYAGNGQMCVGTAPWEQHFAVASAGHIYDLEACTAADMPYLTSFRDYVEQAPVWITGGGGANEYNFGYSDAYFLNFRSNKVDNFTQQNIPINGDIIAATPGQIFTDSHGFDSSGKIVNDDVAVTFNAPNPSTNSLVGNTTGSPFDFGAYFANLLPALAHAVDHGQPGAAASWARFTGASNFSAQSVTANYADVPIWGIVPRSYVVPAPLFNAVDSGSGAIVTTPGPSLILDSAPLLGAGTLVLGPYQGHGIPLSAIVAGGSDGTSPIYDAIQAAGGTVSSLSEIRLVVGAGAHGTYLPDETGGGVYTGDGSSDTVNVDYFLDGAQINSAPMYFGTAPSSTVSGVVVSPSTATGSTTFTAVVNGTGSPSQAVTWTRSGTAGSINASTGVWTAPSQTGSVQTITITATSTQDSSKSGTATVTIAAAVGSTVTGVTVSPASIGVVVGGSQQFAATVAGTLSPSQAVTWTVSGAASISTSGLATGPVGVYTVTATSQQNNTKAGTALFAVLAPGSASLAPDIGLNTLIVQGPVGIAPFIG